jgi:hypothetical protein
MVMLSHSAAALGLDRSEASRVESGLRAVVKFDLDADVCEVIVCRLARDADPGCDLLVG